MHLMGSIFLLLSANIISLFHLLLVQTHSKKEGSSCCCCAWWKEASKTLSLDVHIGWQRTCDYWTQSFRRETFTEAITSIITINLCSTAYSILLKFSNSMWNQPIANFYLKSIQIYIWKHTSSTLRLWVWAVFLWNAML